ncbi:MAG: zinc ribbon domain-containing protein [Candidatus Dormibacteria bacterium]
MPDVLCPNCGSANADNNTFCTKCGASLPGAATQSPDIPGSVPTAPIAGTAAAAPPVTTAPGSPQPPTATTPPSWTAAAAPPLPSAGDAVPPGFGQGQGAFLPPPAPGTAEHKTSHALIIGIVIAAIVLLGGGAVAFVLLRGSPTVATAPPHTTTGTTSPAPSTAPTLRPTPTSAPTNGGGGGAASTIDTPFATVFVPSGYNIEENSSDHVTMKQKSGDGLIIVGVTSLPSGTTNKQLDQTLLQQDQANLDPGAHVCSGTSTENDVVRGSGGQIPADGTAICATVSPTSGPAFQAIDFYIAGVSRASDGSLNAVIVNLFAPSDEFQTFVNSIGMDLGHKTIFKDASPP